MKTAFIAVDVQNDFCEGGSLAVSGGVAVARAIGPHLASAGYDHAVATRDHHVDPVDHFSAEPDFVTSWPRHCVVGTDGVELNPALDVGRIEAVFDKGEYVAAYSGFEGTADGVSLGDWLRKRGVERVVIGGLAADHCVRATALDAVRNGFDTTVRLDLCAGVAPGTTERALAELRAAGVELTGTAMMDD